jgi:hypothetical protein
VVLARKSGQMPEKDQQQAFLKVIAKCHWIAAKI